MSTATHTLVCFHSATLGLSFMSSALGAEQLPAQPPPWPWWHAMPWAGFWWIFPFMFFVLMIVMFVFMIRRGGMGCMWRDRMADRSEFRDAMRRSLGEPSESALEILNKRYAKGEIDKQEYEEKKAAISRSE
jgi:putative membrane protein